MTVMDINCEVRLWQLRDPLRFGNAARLELSDMRPGVIVRPVTMRVSVSENVSEFLPSCDVRLLHDVFPLLHDMLAEGGLAVASDDKTCKAWALLLHGMMQLYASCPYCYVDLTKNILDLGGNPMEVYNADLAGRFPKLVGRCEADPWLYRELRLYLTDHGNRSEFVRRLGMDGFERIDGDWRVLEEDDDLCG